MGKVFVVIAALFIIFIINTKNVYAQEFSAGSSAALLKPVARQTDSRTKILKEFLKIYNSPLVPFADDFVETADKYNLDWKLVAAISGVESTFGQQIPNESYNGWGWGIYGDNIIRFTSWTEGIQTVSEGLRKNYINHLGTDDVYAVGRLYAASPTWAQRVDYFMRKIDEFKDKRLTASLPISL